MKHLLIIMTLIFSSLPQKAIAGNDSICAVVIEGNNQQAGPIRFSGVLTAGKYAYTLTISKAEFDAVSKINYIFVNSPTFIGRVNNLEMVGSVIFGYTASGAPFIIVEDPNEAE